MIPSAHSQQTREAFILANTAPSRAPLVPEIVLNLATNLTPIWQATEAYLTSKDIAPPYWAFAWPGSQALARHILDDPACVTGRRVLDFAAGSGLAAIACAKAGAASIEAADIDPFATAATRLNARANGVTLEATTRDLVGTPCRWDLIVCGDVCYEAPMTANILPWLRDLARSSEVWIADPGRAYVPDQDIVRMATYEVPTSLELECQTSRTTHLMRLVLP